MNRRKAIRIGDKDLIRLHPVGRYQRVTYPTREEARDLGIDLYRVPDSVLRRYGRKAVTGATILLLSTPSCIQGAMVRPHEEVCDPEMMTETESRDLVFRMFEEEGVLLSADYQYSAPGVEANLDGFDEDKRIGYDYFSFDDCEERLNDMSLSGWDNSSLDATEIYRLESRLSDHEDLIVVIEERSVHASQTERFRLANEIDRFLDWLLYNDLI